MLFDSLFYKSNTLRPSFLRPSAMFPSVSVARYVVKTTHSPTRRVPGEGVGVL